MTLYLATGNAHKLAEVRQILDGVADVCSAEDLGGMPQLKETGTTFAANALLKARALAALAPPNALVLADDSGLCVDALGGAPGVRSARYAGENATDADNRALLRAELGGVTEAERTARFVCVLALVGQGREALFEGTCEGHILHSERGQGGFGYDALFIPAGHNRTFAEMSSAVKHTFSHRGAALTSLKAYLSP